MANIDAKTVNELFLQKLGNASDIEKVAQEGAAFIRMRLREAAYSRKIINPTYVTKADLQRSTQHDQLVKIIDIEPDSAATALNLRGQPTTKYVEGERFEISFYQISSPDFQKTEEELLAYEMPLTEVIERNSVKDIQAIEDEGFNVMVDAAVNAAGGNINGAYQANGTVLKRDFNRLFDVLDGNFLRADVLLMDSMMFNRLINYPSTNFGDQLATETFVNGYTYAKLFGRKLVVSNKTNLLDNRIYAFTSQEYLGKFYILNDTKFWIDKTKNLISWSAYELVGMGIGNNSACARLDLT